MDSLRQIAELAARVKLDNRNARERAALKLLITDIIKELDRVTIAMQLRQNSHAPQSRSFYTVSSIIRDIRFSIGG